ncbi:MAG: HigA family addiction module antidote protein [Lachnospiraceae bacterium]|nr:HigA family addiction module antidote protein [Lachnospiraceae bacterium]
MAVKNRGISHDLLIHPGETIYDVLEERGLTQKELAQRAGVSEAFLSDVIHGSKDISKGLAMGLEYALGVPNSFWLNLQANYDAEVLSLHEEESVREEEKEVLTSIHEIVVYLRKMSLIEDGLTQSQMVISLRKLLQVSSLTGLKSLAPTGVFRMSDSALVNPDVLGAWLCLCKVLGTAETIDSRFESEKVDELVSGIKEIMLTGKKDFRKELRSLLAQYGIDFSLLVNFRGAPVHGYAARKEDGSIQMVLTLRGSFADIFWFSLFHELGHIVNGDVSKAGGFIDVQNSRDERREAAADSFACEALLDSGSYKNFVNKGVYSYTAIRNYAKTQNVPPYVVIGRLQKEKIIPWSWYQKYKPRYKWAEAEMS